MKDRNESDTEGGRCIRLSRSSTMPIRHVEATSIDDLIQYQAAAEATGQGYFLTLAFKQARGG